MFVEYTRLSFSEKEEDVWSRLFIDEVNRLRMRETGLAIKQEADFMIRVIYDAAVAS